MSPQSIPSDKIERGAQSTTDPMADVDPGIMIISVSGVEDVERKMSRVMEIGGVEDVEHNYLTQKLMITYRGGEDRMRKIQSELEAILHSKERPAPQRRRRQGRKKQ